MNFEQWGCVGGGTRVVEGVEVELEIAQREKHAEDIDIYIGSWSRAALVVVGGWVCRQSINSITYFRQLIGFTLNILEVNAEVWGPHVYQYASLSRCRTKPGA